MSAEMEIVMRAVLIGGGATVVMDLWTLFLKRVFGVRPLDYAMVGRWIGHSAMEPSCMRALPRRRPSRAKP
jgi:hypothetical protein